MIPKYDLYKKIKKPRKGYNRKCGVCGKSISDWNPNDYCWCHTMKGFELENVIHLRKAYEASRNNRLKHMEEYKRSKKKCGSK